jgi:hypothetical protein
VGSSNFLALVLMMQSSGRNPIEVRSSAAVPPPLALPLPSQARLQPRRLSFGPVCSSRGPAPPPLSPRPTSASAEPRIMQRSVGWMVCILSGLEDCVLRGGPSACTGCQEDHTWCHGGLHEQITRQVGRALLPWKLHFTLLLLASGNYLTLICC